MNVIDQGPRVEIKYKDVGVSVYLNDIKMALGAYKANSADWRRKQVAAVVGHLRQNLVRLRTGRLSRTELIYYALGVAAWYANEVYEGREPMPTTED